MDVKLQLGLFPWLWLCQEMLIAMMGHLKPGTRAHGGGHVEDTRQDDYCTWIADSC